MLLENKYAHHYQALMAKRQSQQVEGYSEKHHVIPKCMGGSDDASNLVRLTAREHFIAHLLLIKAVPLEFRSKLVHAFWLMSHMRSSNQERHYRINSATYSVVRALHAEAIGNRLRGKKLSPDKCEVYRGPKSDEHRQAISKGKQGKLFSSDHKRNISQACKGRRWMSKDGKYRMVDSQEKVDMLLVEGWFLGRTGWSSR